MRYCVALSLLLVSLLSSQISGQSAEPVLEAKDLPRVPPVETTDVMKTFQITKGFHLELAASEPLVMSPIAMSFDENGRLFIVEMRDYSEMRDVKPHMGRIRMLEDTNGDGVFDKATIYADDLPWPTGVFCYGGGIFVAATPDILYFKDTKGNGVADMRKVVFTGFGAGKGDKLNVQGLVNSFNWGLDNRIHGQTAGNGGSVVPADKPNNKALDLNGRDFFFDPRTTELESESGGGQYGMCYDNRGRRFVCSNSHHIQVYMYDSRYAARNPFYHMPPALTDIPVDCPAAEVYRISPEEQWRVIRTKWRVSGTVPGLIEGGGRASGYFTSATGITIFRGDAWKPEDGMDAFIADCGSNLIHRKKVRPDGVGLIAERPPTEQKVEFLASTDLWFRPVQMANAPDGTVYIADMYREVIEHPWSLPQSIKKLLDLNSGNDRGRIYHIVPDGFKQPKLPQLGKASTKELVAILENPNGWHRDTAARLLYERQDKSAVAPLAKLVESSKFPLARMHALHALEGVGALKETQVLTALNDADELVREHAVKLSEKLFNDRSASPKLLAKLQALAADPSITVRYQLAFTLGELKSSARITPLAAIAKQDLESSWTQAAILSSLADGAGELFAKVAGESKMSDSKAGQEFLKQVVMLVGAKNKKEEVAQVLNFISKINQPGLGFVLVRALSDGLQRGGSSLAGAGADVKGILARATSVSTDDSAAEETRIEAAQLLAVTSFDESGKTLLSLLNLKEPQAVQLAAISTLAKFNDPQVASELTKRWETLTPRLRSEAITVLVARPDRATILLKAIEAGKIRPSALTTPQTKFLLNHRDKSVHELAAKVLSAKPESTRQQVIDAFMPALNLKGDAAHGKKIYEERCFSCHRLGGEGHALGPDLVTVKTSGKEKILVNILDPNREVRPDFISYVVETKDDESYIGLVANETATSVTIRQAYSKEDVINRSNIRKMQSQGQSLMPEGLEVGWTPQDVADLIEYIETADAGGGGSK